MLAPGPGTTLDAIYARDASLACPGGIVLCAMGKAARAAEPASQARAFAGVTPSVPILGHVSRPGASRAATWCGSDHVRWPWHRLPHEHRGRRPSCGACSASSIDELVEVPLPHWRGPGDVLHLMSLLSPVDRDLAVVYSPLMAVPFRQRLEAMGIGFVEVPEEEFESMGVNVLALAPRRCVMLTGNPRTQTRARAGRRHA